MTRTVLGIRSFLKEPSLGFWGAAKSEMTLVHGPCGVLLHLRKLQLQNLQQLFPPKRLENHNLVKGDS